MNPIFRALLVVVVLCVFASFTRAGARENQRLQNGKITKNEAQHLILQKFPRATVKSCQMKQEKGHTVWEVTFVKANESAPISVKVDGKTGAIAGQ